MGLAAPDEIEGCSGGGCQAQAKGNEGCRGQGVVQTQVQLAKQAQRAFQSIVKLGA